MRIPYVNNEIMELLLHGYRPVQCAKLTDGLYIFSGEGIVAYILDEKEIYFSLDKCRPNPFDFLRENAPEKNPAYLLTKTMDVRVGKGGALLTRLKADDWDTFVDMDLLEAFDYPNFYQDKRNGVILVTEGTPYSTREVIRGYVMPTRTGVELDNHYNDREAQHGD